jgi:hypothetical protein
MRQMDYIGCDLAELRTVLSNPPDWFADRLELLDQDKAWGAALCAEVVWLTPEE